MTPRRSGSRVVAGWAFAVVVIGCHSKEAPAPEEAATEAPSVTCVGVEKGALERSIDLRGRVATRPGGDLPVASMVAGKLLEIDVEEGARVTKGTLIAMVDDLAPRAAAGQAYATVARARAAKAEADAALERAKKLEKDGVLAKADLEAAQAKSDAAHSDVMAEEAAAGLATGTLSRAEVRATFDGVVTKVWRGAGALVDGTAATPIVEVAADSALEFVADATERDLALARVGAKADVTLSANGATLTGEVVSVPRSLDLPAGLGTIRILLRPPETADAKRAFEEVRIGAFGRAHVHATNLSDVVSIPRAAIRGSVLDGAEVAVCADGKASVRPIVTGYRDIQRVEVVSGLAAGDRVAVGDVLGLYDGGSITEVAPSSASEGSLPHEP